MKNLNEKNQEFSKEELEGLYKQAILDNINLSEKSIKLLMVSLELEKKNKSLKSELRFRKIILGIIFIICIMSLIFGGN